MATTVIVAVAGEPSRLIGPLAVMSEVMLTCTPIAAPVTLIEKVHEIPGARVTPDRLIIFEAGTAVMVPPSQEPIKPLSGVDTIRPGGDPGRVSVNAIPLSGSGLAAGLVIVKLSAVLPKNSSTCESAKDLVMVGGSSTVSVAVPGFPLPPWSEVTGPVVLFFTPGVFPTMTTLNVQDALGGRLAPANVMVVEPDVAVTGKPLQVALDVDTVTPDGRASMNPTPLNVPSAVVLGFVMVNVRVEVFPAWIMGGEKFFVIVGGSTTVIDADEVFPVPPFVELTVTLLLSTPPAMPVTLTENVQDALVARVAPVKLMLFDPAVAMIVPPPQLPLRPFGVDTTSPPGSVSVKATPARVAVWFGFVMLKVKATTPFSGTVGVGNDLVIIGGKTTS